MKTTGAKLPAPPKEKKKKETRNLTRKRRTKGWGRDYCTKKRGLENLQRQNQRSQKEKPQRIIANNRVRNTKKQRNNCNEKTTNLKKERSMSDLAPQLAESASWIIHIFLRELKKWKKIERKKKKGLRSVAVGLFCHAAAFWLQFLSADHCQFT